MGRGLDIIRLIINRLLTLHPQLPINQCQRLLTLRSIGLFNLPIRQRLVLHPTKLITPSSRSREVLQTAGPKDTVAWLFSFHLAVSVSTPSSVHLFIRYCSSTPLDGTLERSSTPLSSHRRVTR